MHHQYYGSKNFSQLYNAIKSGPFKGFSNRSNVEELVINSTSGCNYNKLTVHYLKPGAHQLNYCNNLLFNHTNDVEEIHMYRDSLLGNA